MRDMIFKDEELWMSNLNGLPGTYKFEKIYKINVHKKMQL